MLRVARRAAFIVAVVSVLSLALIWPWPAPEVDWRTPVDRALAATDCEEAMRIVDAAAGAGATDAYNLFKTLSAGGKCPNQSSGEGVGDYHVFISSHRDTEGTIESIYDIERSGLETPRRQLVTLALFFCAMPYNSIGQIDNAALASAVPADHGLLMSLHRTRRETCLRLLEHMTASLVEATDRPANRVAYALLMSLPLRYRTRAGVLIGRLMLEKGYVPERSPTAFTDQMRSFAWLRLERAAEEGDEDAIRMMITHLHAGRFHARDDKRAYFWLLRLRSRGGDHPLAQAIEPSLSHEDRLNTQQLEAASR